MISVKSKIRIIISSAAILLGMIIVILPSTILSFSESIMAAVVVVVITFWVTGIIPEYLTALLLFVATMVFSIAPAKITFSGFHSPAFWLVFAGLIIGVGINGTGLGKRIAGKVACHLNGSYMKLIGGLVFAGLAFGFLMPSAMGRIVLLVPIAVSISSHFGFKKGSNGFNGVILAVILGSFIPAFSILPANVPNMILVGMTESLYQHAPLYGEYLLLHFPILGFLKAIIITALILWLYPDMPIMDACMSLEYSDLLSEKETVLAVVLVVLIVLWATDFLHHISPAWIALAGAVLLLLPKIEIVSTRQFTEKINYGTLFFIAGILGLGSMINYTGLGSTSAKYLISYLPLSIDTPFTNYLSLSLSAMFTGIVTTLPGVPAILTPLAAELSHASGFPLESVFMTQVLGFSTILFPYQAPPILIGMQLSQIKLREVLKVLFYLAVISALFLLPLNYLWWKLLGWL